MHFINFRQNRLKTFDIKIVTERQHSHAVATRALAGGVAQRSRRRQGRPAVRLGGTTTSTGRRPWCARQRGAGSRERGPRRAAAASRQTGGGDVASRHQRRMGELEKGMGRCGCSPRVDFSVRGARRRTMEGDRQKGLMLCFLRRARAERER